MGKSENLTLRPSLGSFITTHGSWQHELNDEDIQFTKNTDLQHFHNFNVKVSKKQSSPKLTQCTLPLTFSQHSALSVLKWDHRHGALNTLGQISWSLLISKPPNSKNALRLTSIPFGILSCFRYSPIWILRFIWKGSTRPFVVSSLHLTSKEADFYHFFTKNMSAQSSKIWRIQEFNHTLFDTCFLPCFAFSENAPHG